MQLGLRVIQSLRDRGRGDVQRLHHLAYRHILIVVKDRDLLKLFGQTHNGKRQLDTFHFSL